MSIAGKKGIGFTKADISSQKQPIFAAKKIKFAHKATLNDTSINLAALVLPSAEMPSFVNPSASELASANLLFNKNNFLLISSLKGLMDFDSYSIVSNTTINLLDAASDNEIFIGIIDNVVRNGVQMVDAAPLVATGTLAATVVDFNVGTPFDTNKYPSQQIGAVLVFLDGVLQFRNVSNATAAPSADGNYQELTGLNNTSTVIRFNNADAINSRAVVVVSNGLLAYAPEDSMKAVIDRQAGVIDRLVNTTAILAGVPTTDFQAAPSQPDLKAFGDRVLTLETSYPARKVYGDTSGTAVPAGGIGETVEGSADAVVTAASTGVYKEVATIILTPGKWLITANIGIRTELATIVAGDTVDVAIADVTASNTGATIHSGRILNTFQNTTGTTKHFPNWATRIVRHSTTTTYYLNGAITYTGTAPKWGYGYIAVRIA